MLVPVLDTEALMDGFWYGFRLVFLAGAGGWSINLFFKTIKNIIGG